nr:TPA_asm: hypothetical protein [Schistorhabdovirus]
MMNLFLIFLTLFSILLSLGGSYCSYSAVCDEKSAYKEVKVQDVPCRPFGYSKTTQATVNVYQTHDLELDGRVCICESFKITQFCKSNILWSVDRWEHTAPTTVPVTDCVKQCRSSMSTKTNLDSTMTDPVHCPWWSSAQNTTISLRSTLHSGFYNYLTRTLTLTTPTFFRCTLSNHHTCIWDTGKTVVVDSQDLESHCHGDVTTYDAMITTITQSQFEVTIPEKEWVLTVSHPCITDLCDFKGIATLEGKLISSRFFNNSLLKCASSAHFGLTGSLLAFEEYNSEKAIHNDMHQKSLLCGVAKSLLSLELRLNQPIEQGLLNLLTEMSGYTKLYKAVNGRLLSKACNVTWVKSYTQLCLSVWRAETTLGVFYAGADHHQLTTQRPTCSNTERYTILPGNFLVVGSMKNRAVSLGVLHKENLLGITHELDEHVGDNSVFPMESDNNIVSNQYSYDDKFSLHFPNIKIGVTVSLAAICLFSAITIFCLLKACRSRRSTSRGLPPRYHEVVESIPLTRVNRI